VKVEPTSILGRLQAAIASLPHCPAHDVLLTMDERGILDCDICRTGHAPFAVRGYQA
jgi:hypothetical protein